MSVTPMTDPFGGVYESALALLAGSAAWRTWTDTDTSSEASAFIRFSSGDAEDLPNPCAVIFSDATLAWTSDSAGAGCYFPPSPKGEIQVVFIADIPDQFLVNVQAKTNAVANWQIADKQAAERWFMSQVGSVIKGMADNSGVSGYLVVTKFAVKEPLSISDVASGEIKPTAMMTYSLEV